jgi:hypothetical protein
VAYTRLEVPVLRARSLAAVIVALWLITAPGSIPGTSRSILPDLRLVSSDGVEAFVPPRWEYRPLSQMTTSARKGIEALGGRARSSEPFDVRKPGLQAYWVDATQVRVPSDYYSLAARGPLMDSIAGLPNCRTETSDVLIGRGHRADPMSGYLATTSGRCDTEEVDTLWAAVVAAPGFGPVRDLGIPESGLYFVQVSVRDGPGAEDRLGHLIEHISFGGTPIAEFSTAASVPGRPV